MQRQLEKLTQQYQNALKLMSVSSASRMGLWASSQSQVASFLCHLTWLTWLMTCHSPWSIDQFLHPFLSWAAGFIFLQLPFLSHPNKILCVEDSMMGNWHQRAYERHGNPPQGNQELLVVRDKVGRPPGELGVSKSNGMWYFSLPCFDTVGWATGRASGL